jgi:hypothetical protein
VNVYRDCWTTSSPATANNSLIEDGGCGISNGINGNLTGDPFLDSLGLQNNGGSVQTIALAAASPAVNAGDNAYLTEAILAVDYNGDGDTTDTLSTDQRGTGFNRTVNTTVDLGAFEATDTVSLLVDTNSDNNLAFCSSRANDCSLRGAINLANVHSGTDTISFSSSVFNTAQTITLTADLPTISSSMTIIGPNTSSLTINGADSYRPFVLANGADVEMSYLTISQSYSGSDGVPFR